ncbi:hypothetical protein P7228_04900 [Altererythrobacter arenosus]|uniref:Uncharacterized protein n=1 Tax=Altererythrobacter arenosus TaxID=3032592 RepID=A0ABY8FYF2_9SPHN|nr:hypothetical protein [Altererythrobacter sp. CAU 1644]WFL78406.1 hypothetical protein P7228_04900 [Altererythrobacter sp. CAU 1644]
MQSKALKSLPFAMLALLLASCATTNSPRLVEDCAAADKIGLFDPSRDLLIANYDSKPDVDDLQAVAGLGSVLKHPAYSCVDFIATHGAYGMQTGKFLPAAELFTLAFGDRWLDAHADREATVAQLAHRMGETISAGGKVWVAEAGQSDVTAAAVERLPKDMWTRVHVVQHSYWNESMTAKEAMQTVVYNTRYHRIQDGNFPDNGSPAFNTKDGSHWPVLLADPEVGPIWAEAKRLSDLHNPVAEYVNPAVSAGGMDFSDTVEIAYIFGFDDMEGVGDFVARFAANQR